MIRLERLPLSDATRTAVRAWAARWESSAWASMRHEDAVASGEPLPDEVPQRVWDELAIEQRALLERLRTELGSGYDVQLSSGSPDAGS
jgi:hypothetical protein